MTKKTTLFVFAFCLIGMAAHATISGGSSSGGSGSPIGAAGGDLSGSYPNPVVATIGGQTLGTSAFQPASAFDAAGAAAAVKSYFTGLTGYLSCTGSGCSATVSIPGSAVSGNIAGSAANVTGTILLANGGTGATSPSTLQTSLTNAQALMLPKLRACLGRVMANAGNCTILAVGDSTTFGNFSNNSNTGNWLSLSYPSQLATMLNAAGINANANSIMGFLQASYSSFTLGSDWTTGSSTLGGNFAIATANTGNPGIYVPSSPVDTYKVYYINTSGGGTLNITINGTTTAQSENASTSVGIKTITTTLGTAPMSISWGSGGTIYVIGVVAYNSAISQVNIVNAGWGGSKSTDWNITSNPYSPATMIGNFGQDATILSLGINDWVASTTGQSAYSTAMQSLITAAKTQGDVMLFSPAPSQTTVGQATASNQASYVSILQGLAISNNLPYVDMYSKWVSYTVSNALGLYPGIRWGWAASQRHGL